MKPHLYLILLTLLFSIVIITISSCQKELANGYTSAPVLDTAITDSSIFIDFTIDGKRVFGIQNRNAGPYVGGQQWGNMLTDTSIFDWERFGSCFVTGTGDLPYFAFSKGSLNLNQLPYLNVDSVHGPIPFTTLDSFFKPGTYPYAVRTHDTTYNYYFGSNTLDSTVTHSLLSHGISILWIDADGNTWQTCNGTADQTGSYFTITQNKVYPDPNTDFALGNVISVSFSCKLYDRSGNMKQITNGRFRLSEDF